MRLLQQRNCESTIVRAHDDGDWSDDREPAGNDQSARVSAAIAIVHYSDQDTHTRIRNNSKKQFPDIIVHDEIDE